MKDHVPYVFDERNEKDLASIYRQISVHPDREFDTSQKEEFLIGLLEATFTKTELMADGADILADDNRLNLAFVTYIRRCSKEGSIDVAGEFIVFCDYFLMDYNKTYLKLHDKLKALVVKGYKALIGKREYQKLENRMNPNRHKTLFELFGGGNETGKI
jgi:hypothetical protein